MTVSVRSSDLKGSPVHDVHLRRKVASLRLDVVGAVVRHNLLSAVRWGMPTVVTALGIGAHEILLEVLADKGETAVRERFGNLSDAIRQAGPHLADTALVRRLHELRTYRNDSSHGRNYEIGEHEVRAAVEGVVALLEWRYPVRDGRSVYGPEPLDVSDRALASMLVSDELLVPLAVRLDDLARLVAAYGPRLDGAPEIARAVGVPDAALWGRTHVDRWRIVLECAAECGALDATIERAAEWLSDRPGLDLQARAFRARAASLVANVTPPADVSRRVAAAALRELAPEALRPSRDGPGARRRRVFGAWLLIRVWGEEAPGGRVLEALWTLLEAPDAPADIEKTCAAARDRGWLAKEDDSWQDVGRLLVIAADTLTTWMDADREGGAAFLRAVLDAIETLDVLQLDLLALALRWSPPARETVACWERDVLAQAPVRLTRQERHLTLMRLARCDRLLRAAGAADWSAADGPPSVRWAVRSGDAQYAAALLEHVGERDVEAYASRLDGATGEGYVSLLSTVRRLVAGDPTRLRGVADPVARAAVRASLPTAAAAEVDALVGRPEVLRTWLDILAPPFGAPQLRLLIRLFARDESHLTALAPTARRLLLRAPDLLPVWDALGDAPGSLRDRWVERDGITDAELGQPNVHALADELRRRPPTQAASTLAERMAAARSRAAAP